MFRRQCLLLQLQQQFQTSHSFKTSPPRSLRPTSQASSKRNPNPFFVQQEGNQSLHKKKLFRRPNISSFTVIFNFPFGSRKKAKTIKTIITQNKALHGLSISETALLMIHSQWSVLLFFTTFLHTHFQLN